MKLTRCILISMLWLGLISPTFAAADPAVVARARVDKVQMTVGDWLSYELVVVVPSGWTAELPATPTDKLGEWEVHSCAATAAQPVDGGTQQGWTCLLTIWKVGYHPLPTQVVKVANANGETSRATTQPLSVQVVSVLDPNPTDIKPLKPQLLMNEQANYLLIIGLSLLAILVAGFLVWAIMYYRRHRPVPVPAAGPSLAHDPVAMALAELDRIARLNLVAEGRLVEHYALIADVLRRYIADRFGVPALERTTSEVRAALSTPAMLQRRDSLLALLAESDGVKFARILPSAQQATAMIDHARQTILATR